MTDSGPGSDSSARRAASDRLDSWKEIAGYLRRDERTVRRWEKSEGLPVHRHVHEQRASVFAYRHEVDAWLERRGEIDAAEAGPPGNRAKDPPADDHVRRIPVLGWAGGAALAAVAAWFAWGAVWRPAAVPAVPYRVLIADPVPPSLAQPAARSDDESIRDVLEREIVDASGVDVVARDELAETLRLMRRSPSRAIDGAIAQEVALRRGDVDALLEWSLEERAGTRQVVLSLRNPLDGGLIASWEEAALTDISPAAVRVGRRAAPDLVASLDALGPRAERLMPFRGMEGMHLEDATTASFEAWRLYAEAMTLHFAFQWRQSAELLERAVAADPAFATAHVFLGRAYTSLREPEQARASYRRAFELAESVTDRERYFIHAAYFEHVLRSPIRAAAAYSTLLVTYPDHYWGVIYASWFHSQHGNSQRVIEYLARYADARPNHLEMTVRAAFAMGAWGKSPEWADRYVDRARRLLAEPTRGLLAQPNLVDRLSTGDTAWLALRDVYTRWQATDVEGALEALQELEARSHSRFAPWLGRAYIALGRLGDAERLFSDLALDDIHRHEGLVAVSLARGDVPELRRHLADIGRGAVGWFVVLRVRAGQYSADDPPSPIARVVRGAVALRAGRTDESIALLEAALPRLAEWAEEGYYVALESLALAWQQAGDLDRAAETLEVTRGMRAQAAFGANFRPLLWLRAQSQLADLYRALGRDHDAEALDLEIAALLAVADPDHALLARAARR